MKTVDDSQPAVFSSSLKFVMVLLPSLLLVAAIWAPFGYSLIGNIEEWGLLGAFSSNGVFFLTTPNSPLPAHALRPLTIFPQALAYYLDPYSFKYWNWLLAFSIVVKGASLTYIVRHVTSSWLWGIVAGVLLIIYPADTMQLSFRALHINWALACLLLGVAIFLKALCIDRKIVAGLLAASAAILLACACGMYEASLLLAPMPVLLLMAQHQLNTWMDHLKRRLWLHAIWACGALAYVVYVLHTAPLVRSYQSALSGEHATDTLFKSLPRLFDIGLLRTVAGGWYDAVRITAAELSTYGYAVLVVAVILIVCGTLLRKRGLAGNEAKAASLFKLLFVGLAIAMLGYAPFLLSLPHQSISQRTFLFASPGGVIAWVAVLGMLYRLSGVLAVTLAGGLVFFGFSTQLYQFHHYVNLSDREKEVLNSIATQFDGEADGKTILVLDHTNQLNATWMFLRDNLRSTMNYMYGKNFKSVEICHMPGLEWQQRDDIARNGTCEQTDDSWVFHWAESVSGPGVAPTVQKPDRRVSKKDVVIIEVDPDSGNQPSARLANESERFGKIYEGVIAPSPARWNLQSFTDQSASSSYSWHFGDWWSMDLPIAGSGWREAEWNVGSFYHYASTWKTGRTAELLFKIAPSETPYDVDVKFNFIVNGLKDTTRIQVNGVDVPSTWSSDLELTARLEPRLLKKGVNTFTLISDVDTHYYGLAMRIVSLNVKPAP